MLTVKVKDRDRGLKKLQRNLKNTGKHFVKVGIFGDSASAAHAGTQKSNVEIAGFQEFGTSRIPARSFIRATVDAEQNNIKKLQVKLGRNIIKLRTTEPQGLGLIGVFLQGAMQKRIQGGISPALSPKTIQRKGSSKALIDTGQLVQSIAWSVERGKLKA